MSVIKFIIHFLGIAFILLLGLTTRLVDLTVLVLSNGVKINRKLWYCRNNPNAISSELVLGKFSPPNQGWFWGSLILCHQLISVSTQVFTIKYNNSSTQNIKLQITNMLLIWHIPCPATTSPESLVQRRVCVAWRTSLCSCPHSNTQDKPPPAAIQINLIVSTRKWCFK